MRVYCILDDGKLVDAGLAYRHASRIDFVLFYYGRDDVMPVRFQSFAKSRNDVADHDAFIVMNGVMFQYWDDAKPLTMQTVFAARDTAERSGVIERL